MDEVLKDQNPMCGEMDFLLRVGKSKINMFKDCKSYIFFYDRSKRFTPMIYVLVVGNSLFKRMNSLFNE